jgi:ribosomal protein S18 acetylase RimI-like enzyme
MHLVKDEFDTSILGQNVFKITLHEATDIAQVEKEIANIEKGIICCFSPLTYSHVAMLERLNFQLISIRNTYQLRSDFVNDISFDDAFLIKPFEEADIIDGADIERMAKNIYAYSRFCKDEKMPRRQSLDIYLHWIKNSLHKKYTDINFIAWVQNKPVGICTAKIKDDVGYIDLLGVISDYQDKKIGKHLLSQTIEYLKSKKVSSICVITEGENLKANAFYQKNGFVIAKVELVYHKHLI